jgi:hypothetical protein
MGSHRIARLVQFPRTIFVGWRCGGSMVGNRAKAATRKPTGAAAIDPAGFGRRGGSTPHARRTHWTPGKRRHAIEPWLDPKILVRNLREIGQRRKSDELARLLGVNRATIFRWRRGIDHPPPEQQAKMVRVFSQWGLSMF